MQWRGATPCWLKTASAGIESPTVLSETEDGLAERRSGFVPLFCQIKFQLYLTGTLADFTLLAIDAPALWRIDFLYGVGGIFGFFPLKASFYVSWLSLKKNKK